MNGPIAGIEVCATGVGRRAAGLRKTTAALMSVLLLATTVGGCYKYAPLEGDPEVGEKVRARIAAGSAEEGPESVLGRVLGVSADSLVLEAPRVEQRRGGIMISREDSLAFARARVLRLEQQEVNLLGTAAIVGAGVVAVALLVGSAVNADTDPEDGGPVENGGEAVWVPFHITFP